MSETKYYRYINGTPKEVKGWSIEDIDFWVTKTVVTKNEAEKYEME